MHLDNPFLYVGCALCKYIITVHRKPAQFILVSELVVSDWANGYCTFLYLFLSASLSVCLFACL